ncbi:MAG: peptidase domain-containing ABC transporter [Treponema sp.]|nr:peptidase domain-containing ABC transporter [Treponema sp.]
MRYQRQLDETDCGPACIAMVASHYNLHVSPGRVRELSGTDLIGTNLAGMVYALEKLGFSVSAMRGEVRDDTLDVEITLPLIAHVQIPQGNNKHLDHYVVIKKISRKKVTVWDPDFTRGRQKINRSDFLKLWTGYVLLLSPGTDFKVGEKGKSNLLKFLPLVFPHKKILIVVSLASALLIVMGILVANYYRYIMDEVIPAKATFTLAGFSIGVMLVILTQQILEGLRGTLINFFAFKVGIHLNFSYVSHILKLPVSFFSTRKTGDILTRLDDTEKIMDTLSGTVLTLLFDFLLILIVGPFLFNMSAVLFAVSLANMIVMGVIIFFFSRFFRHYYGKMRREEAEVNSTLVEAIAGIYAIKALNAEKDTGKVYEEKQMKAVWTGWKTARLSIWQSFFAGLLNGLTSTAIFWIGSIGIIGETFSFGTLLSFNALSAFFIGPLFRIINIQPEIQEASVAAQRVSEILELEPEQPEGAALAKPAAIKGDIEFKNISFRYGMRSPVYKDLSFRIDKGQWAAFVGPSGCGKTTLVKLLLKFYQPEKGTVNIDGHDLRYIDTAALRSRIGYVPQDIYIFAGTVAENIALGNPNAPMEDIIAAAGKAGAHEFISALPEHYETKLSEHGSTLSGGEKQRLALARALLENREIIILDEATSSLDTVSERAIHETIEKLRGSVTAILIAHRLTTIKNCDVIFVMDKGDIVEYGSHKALLEKNGLYKKLWEETAL